MSISLAFFWEDIDLTSSTAGVEQKSPHLIPGHENVDLWVAKVISQAIDNWNPAAAAIPFTTQTVGAENVLTCSMSLEQRSNIYLGFEDPCSSFKSWPELKTGP